MALTRIERAVQLRMAGATYAEIAERIGVDALEAEDMVARFLEASIGEPDRIRVRLELARLDALLKGIWGQAVLGDTTAVGQALKITGQRAALLAKLGGAAAPEPELAKESVADELAKMKHEFMEGNHG